MSSKQHDDTCSRLGSAARALGQSARGVLGTPCSHLVSVGTGEKHSSNRQLVTPTQWRRVGLGRRCCCCGRGRGGGASDGLQPTASEGAGPQGAGRGRLQTGTFRGNMRTTAAANLALAPLGPRASRLVRDPNSVANSGPSAAVSINVTLPVVSTVHTDAEEALNSTVFVHLELHDGFKQNQGAKGFYQAILSIFLNLFIVLKSEVGLYNLCEGDRTKVWLALAFAVFSVGVTTGQLAKSLKFMNKMLFIIYTTSGVMHRALAVAQFMVSVALLGSMRGPVGGQDWGRLLYFDDELHKYNLSGNGSSAEALKVGGWDVRPARWPRRSLFGNDLPDSANCSSQQFVRVLPSLPVCGNSNVTRRGTARDYGDYGLRPDYELPIVLGLLLASLALYALVDLLITCLSSKTQRLQGLLTESLSMRQGLSFVAQVRRHKTSAFILWTLPIRIRSSVLVHQSQPNFPSAVFVLVRTLENVALSLFCQAVSRHTGDACRVHMRWVFRLGFVLLPIANICAFAVHSLITPSRQLLTNDVAPEAIKEVIVRHRDYFSHNKTKRTAGNKRGDPRQQAKRSPGMPPSDEDLHVSMSKTVTDIEMDTPLGDINRIAYGTATVRHSSTDRARP